MTDRRHILWTFAITSTALFMGSLDNLVVTTALPSIRAHLHASLADLQWTVNAYTLTFAVLLLTGAALGERFGRRRVFVAGLGLFTAGSATAALAPGIGWLIAARALQGVGAAVMDIRGDGEQPTGRLRTRLRAQSSRCYAQRLRAPGCRAAPGRWRPPPAG
jgi:MFS family permease